MLGGERKKSVPFLSCWGELYRAGFKDLGERGSASADDILMILNCSEACLVLVITPTYVVVKQLRDFAVHDAGAVREISPPPFSSFSLSFFVTATRGLGHDAGDG